MTVETARMLDFPSGCLIFKCTAVVLNEIRVENRFKTALFPHPFGGLGADFDKKGR